MKAYWSSSPEGSCGPPCVCAEAIVAAAIRETGHKSEGRCTRCGREFKAVPFCELRVVEGGLSRKGAKKKNDKQPL
jgi:hypothetical protein